jgi:hypothetical protein
MIKEHGGDFHTAIISSYRNGHDEARAFITLDTYKGLRAPRFHPINPGDRMLVLSYGKQYEFRVDRGANVVSYNDALFISNGALLIGADAMSIRVFPFTDTKPKIYYMVATGEGKQGWENLDGKIAVLEWSIHLSGEPDNSQPFFRFSGKTSSAA